MMIAYASRTGTKRNLAVLRAAGWRLMVSATGAHRTEGFPYALDNGAWTAHAQGRPFDGDAFERALSALGAAADFVVLPDIVAGGKRSLDLSVSWLPRVTDVTERIYLPLQDGMVPSDLELILPSVAGLFLGGTTEWKESTMPRWGEFCRARGLAYHVGRVNTKRRIRAAALAGADSFDGTSATRFAVNIPFLDTARRQETLALEGA